METGPPTLGESSDFDGSELPPRRGTLRDANPDMKEAAN